MSTFKETKYNNCVVTHDTKHNLVYIYVNLELKDKAGCVEKTICVNNSANPDFDENGDLIGVEIT